MKIYTETRSAALVDVFHQRGLCVSYDRLKTIITDIVNSIIAYWTDLGVAVPPQTIHGVFTIGGYDNVDHNPPSNTSRYAVHGTCSTLHQNFSGEYQTGAGVVILNPAEMGSRFVKPLPQSYTDIDYDMSVSKDEAHSFIGVNHLCRTRYIHQVYVAAIYAFCS